jgi:signal transduction histidine kinase
MTIKKRLILSLVIVNTALFIIGITVFFGYRHVMSKASLANDFDKESMFLQMILRGIQEVVINEGIPSMLEENRDGIEIQVVKEGLDGFEAIHERLLTEIKDPELLMYLYEQINPDWQFINDTVEPLFEHYLKLNNDQTMLIATTLIKATEDIIKKVNILSDQTRAVVNENSVKSDIVQLAMVAIIFISLLLSSFLSYQVYRSIASPIRELNTIAAGFTKGDLNNTMDEKRRDEFGLLALHFNKSIAKLKQYNQELQDFAHIASHDLQEPLRKIMAFGGRLQTKYSESLEDQGRDYLERMQKATGRMQRLVDDLLVYSRVIRGGKPFIPVNLTSIAEQALSDLDALIQYTGAHIEVDNMPPLNADPVQMQQLFENIIGNALKFRKEDEPPVVKVSGILINGTGNGSHSHDHEDEYCQITFEDNGIGFDKKYTDRIFTVFQKLHSYTRYEGTGIGLSVCRKIVQRHGGHITAVASPGEGAKFLITLPVNQNNSESSFNHLQDM